MGVGGVEDKKVPSPHMSWKKVFQDMWGEEKGPLLQLLDQGKKNPGQKDKNRAKVPWKTARPPGKVSNVKMPPLPPSLSRWLEDLGAIRAHRGGRWGFSCQLAASLSLLLTPSLA